MKKLIPIFIFLFSINMFGQKKDDQNKDDDKKGKNIKLTIITPLQNQKYKAADTLYLTWMYPPEIDKENLDKQIDIFLSTNYGADWGSSISTKFIKDKELRWQIPDFLKSDHCLIKVVKKDDEDINLEEAKSNRFIISNIDYSLDYDSVGYSVKGGLNFNYAAQEDKFSGLYLGITATFPHLFTSPVFRPFGWFQFPAIGFGVDLYLAQGRTKREDSNYIYKDTSLVTLFVGKRQNQNHYVAASIIESLGKNLQIILPHFEFRYVSSDIYTLNYIKGYISERRYRPDSVHTPYDTLIFYKDSTITNLTNQIGINYFLGTGLRFVYKSKSFDLCVQGMIGTDLAPRNNSVPWDYLVRFNLRNNQSGISIGGDIRGPLSSGSTNEPFDVPFGRATRVFEVLIYGSLELSLDKIIKTGLK